MRALATFMCLLLAFSVLVIYTVSHQVSALPFVPSPWPPPLPDCGALDDWDYVDCVTGKAPAPKESPE